MTRTPKYRLHKPSGRAVVTLAGKQHYLGKYNSAESKREYHRILAEYHASAGQICFGTDPEEVTLAMLMVDYLAHCKKHYPSQASPETNQVKLIFRVVKKLYADLPAIEFGPRQFKAVRQTLVDDPTCQRGRGNRKKNAKPLARKYINAQMSRLTRMFRWAAADGIIPSHVYNDLRIIPGLKAGRTSAPETKKILPVSQDVVDATLKECPPVLADMIRVQLLTGCRPAEVCALTPAMIDRSGEVWRAHLIDHKGAWRGKDRIIYIGPEAQAVLRPYLDRDQDANLFSPAECDAQRRAMLTELRKTPTNQGNKPGYNSRTRSGKKQPQTSRLGTAYTSISYGRVIYYRCKKAGVPKWAPNQLRHSAATKARSEFGLDHAAGFLGHAEVGVTQVYAEQDERKAIEVALRLG